MAKSIVSAIIFAIVLSLVPGHCLAQSVEFHSVEVTKKIDERRVEVRTTDRSKNQDSYIIDTLSDKYLSSPRYEVGDRLIVSVTLVQGKKVASIIERDRTIPYIALFALFVAVVVVVGRLQGAVSIIAMAVSFILLVTVTIPQIIEGVDPIVVSLLTALVVVPLTFILSHGLNQKTILAVITTLIALAFTGVLSAFSARLANLTGYASEEASSIVFRFGGSLRLSDLTVAGMIISSMGILDDVTISQIGIVRSLSKTKPNIRNTQLFVEAMKLGRDHIASLVNTLVLVYVGAALPMFLLIYKSDIPLWIVLQRESIAEEIVRTLVSSIGIILAVPLATFFAVRWGKKRVGFLQKERLF